MVDQNLHYILYQDYFGCKYIFNYIFVIMKLRFMSCTCNFWKERLFILLKFPNNVLHLYIWVMFFQAQCRTQHRDPQKHTTPLWYGSLHKLNFYKLEGTEHTIKCCLVEWTL